MIRINAISGPRNISTAVMYSFAQRPDATVLDEPFYGCYLKQTGIVHPGRDEVMESLPQSEDQVRRRLRDPWPTDVLFIKNMAHHMALVDQSFVEEVVNIFLVRDPRQILASYADVIQRPTLGDIGIEYQHMLFQKLATEGRHPVVLDAGSLLSDPQSILKQLCDRLGIQFFPQMLRWEAGPKPYDGVWAPYWYANVHRSTGFERQPSSNRTLPAHLEGLNKIAQDYYRALVPFSLQP
ncbi:MAG TPA: hypothetical protein VK666_03760 [Chryseolinea sp.]|nr:hypothetical protein [Chryseolinea sp.]